jgi:uncharacterized damage-inducible protein DinB
VREEQAKAVADAMASMWEREFAATTKVLAAVKDEGKDYRPDPKSRTAWQLATHIASADIWFLDSILEGKFEWNPDAAKKVEEGFGTIAEVVGFYQKTLPGRLASLKELTGAQAAEPVDFFGMMKMSRAEWIGFANNHSVHHRGQLASYLRALGSKVPDIYGPSADAGVE